MKGPVWTWEVPLYFWFGGLAAGSSFEVPGSSGFDLRVAVPSAYLCEYL